jgi:hypothetical protein
MDKLSFKDFEELCEANMDKRHIDECVDVIKNNECLFFPGIVMPNSHIASLYALRLEIAKENNKLGDEYIDDFEDVVANLKKSTSKDLAITSVFGERHGYMIFYEPVTKRILGAIKSKVDNGLIKQDNSSFKRYFKGVLMEDPN